MGHRSQKAYIAWLEAILARIKRGDFDEIVLHDENITVVDLPDGQGQRRHYLTGERRVTLVLRRYLAFRPATPSIEEVVADALHSRQEPDQPRRIAAGGRSG